MKKSNNEINASSMADIAFLLLIFFLVTTTIDQDKGILSKLPPDIIRETAPSSKRNVLEIFINSENQLMIEGKPSNIENVKQLTLKHIKNYKKDPNLSDSPLKAIISLQNDRGTSYETYIMLQNELKAAYNEVRNESALKITKGKYNYLELKICIDKEDDKSTYCKTIKNKVKSNFPMKISESNPTEIAKNL